VQSKVSSFILSVVVRVVYAANRGNKSVGASGCV
jgi:hypothetical protein